MPLASMPTPAAQLPVQLLGAVVLICVTCLAPGLRADSSAGGAADDDDQRVRRGQRRRADRADLAPGEAVAELGGRGGAQQLASAGEA